MKTQHHELEGAQYQDARPDGATQRIRIIAIPAAASGMTWVESS